MSALGGTRTPSLLIRSQMLYPLSYERWLEQYTVAGALAALAVLHAFSIAAHTRSPSRAMPGRTWPDAPARPDVSVLTVRIGLGRAARAPAFGSLVLLRSWRAVVTGDTCPPPTHKAWSLPRGGRICDGNLITV